MGKHSKEVDKLNTKKMLLAVIIIISLFIIALAEIWTYKNEFKLSINNGFPQIEHKKQKLLLKSTSDYDRILEFDFENEILKSLKIYEKFEDKQKFDKVKEKFIDNEEIDILDINEKKLSIKIEKLELGNDKGLSYDEIYDKYLVQIVGAYQQIQ